MNPPTPNTGVPLQYKPGVPIFVSSQLPPGPPPPPGQQLYGTPAQYMVGKQPGPLVYNPLPYMYQPKAPVPFNLHAPPGPLISGPPPPPSSQHVGYPLQKLPHQYWQNLGPEGYHHQGLHQTSPQPHFLPGQPVWSAPVTPPSPNPSPAFVKAPGTQISASPSWTGVPYPPGVAPDQACQVNTSDNFKKAAGLHGIVIESPNHSPMYPDPSPQTFHHDSWTAPEQQIHRAPQPHIDSTYTWTEKHLDVDQNSKKSLTNSAKFSLDVSDKENWHSQKQLGVNQGALLNSSKVSVEDEFWDIVKPVQLSNVQKPHSPFARAQKDYFAEGDWDETDGGDKFLEDPLPSRLPSEMLRAGDGSGDFVQGTRDEEEVYEEYELSGDSIDIIEHEFVTVNSNSSSYYDGLYDEDVDGEHEVLNDNIGDLNDETTGNKDTLRDKPLDEDNDNNKDKLGDQFLNENDDGIGDDKIETKEDLGDKLSNEDNAENEDRKKGIKDELGDKLSDEKNDGIDDGKKGIRDELLDENDHDISEHNDEVKISDENDKDIGDSNTDHMESDKDVCLKTDSMEHMPPVKRFHETLAELTHQCFKEKNVSIENVAECLVKGAFNTGKMKLLELFKQTGAKEKVMSAKHEIQTKPEEKNANNSANRIVILEDDLNKGDGDHTVHKGKGLYTWTVREVDPSVEKASNDGLSKECLGENEEGSSEVLDEDINVHAEVGNVSGKFNDMATVCSDLGQNGSSVEDSIVKAVEGNGIPRVKVRMYPVISNQLEDNAGEEDAEAPVREMYVPLTEKKQEDVEKAFFKTQAKMHGISIVSPSSDETINVDEGRNETDEDFFQTQAMIHGINSVSDFSYEAINAASGGNDTEKDLFKTQAMMHGITIVSPLSNEETSSEVNTNHQPALAERDQLNCSDFEPRMDSRRNSWTFERRWSFSKPASEETGSSENFQSVESSIGDASEAFKVKASLHGILIQDPGDVPPMESEADWDVAFSGGRIRHSSIASYKSDSVHKSTLRADSIEFTPGGTTLNVEAIEFNESNVSMAASDISDKPDSSMRVGAPVFKPSFPAHSLSKCDASTSVQTPSTGGSHPLEVTPSKGIQASPVMMEMCVGTRRLRTKHQATDTSSCDTREVAINTVESIDDEESDFYTEVPEMPAVCTKSTMTDPPQRRSVGVNVYTKNSAMKDGELEKMKQVEAMRTSKVRSLGEEVRQMQELLQQYEQREMNSWSPAVMDLVTGTSGNQQKLHDSLLQELKRHQTDLCSQLSQQLDSINQLVQQLQGGSVPDDLTNKKGQVPSANRTTKQERSVSPCPSSGSSNTTNNRTAVSNSNNKTVGETKKSSPCTRSSSSNTTDNRTAVSNINSNNNIVSETDLSSNVYNGAKMSTVLEDVHEIADLTGRSFVSATAAVPGPGVSTSPRQHFCAASEIVTLKQEQDQKTLQSGQMIKKTRPNEASMMDMEDSASDEENDLTDEHHEDAAIADRLAATVYGTDQAKLHAGAGELESGDVGSDIPPEGSVDLNKLILNKMYSEYSDLRLESVPKACDPIEQFASVAERTKPQLYKFDSIDSDVDEERDVDQNGVVSEEIPSNDVRDLDGAAKGVSNDDTAECVSNGDTTVPFDISGTEVFMSPSRETPKEFFDNNQALAVHGLPKAGGYDQYLKQGGMCKNTDTVVTDPDLYKVNGYGFDQQCLPADISVSQQVRNVSKADEAYMYAKNSSTAEMSQQLIHASEAQQVGARYMDQDLTKTQTRVRDSLGPGSAILQGTAESCKPVDNSVAVVPSTGFSGDSTQDMTAGKNAAIDPTLFQAVLSQLVNVYPELDADPEMLTKVALQQTHILQLYVSGGPSGGNTGIIPGTASTTQGLIPTSPSYGIGNIAAVSSPAGLTTGQTSVNTLMRNASTHPSPLLPLSDSTSAQRSPVDQMQGLMSAMPGMARNNQNFVSTASESIQGGSLLESRSPSSQTHISTSEGQLSASLRRPASRGLSDVTIAASSSVLTMPSSASNLRTVVNGYPVGLSSETQIKSTSVSEIQQQEGGNVSSHIASGLTTNASPKRSRPPGLEHVLPLLEEEEETETSTRDLQDINSRFKMSLGNSAVSAHRATNQPQHTTYNVSQRTSQMDNPKINGRMETVSEGTSGIKPSVARTRVPQSFGRNVLGSQPVSGSNTPRVVPSSQQSPQCPPGIQKSPHLPGNMVGQSQSAVQKSPNIPDYTSGQSLSTIHTSAHIPGYTAGHFPSLPTTQPQVNNSRSDPPSRNPMLPRLQKHLDTIYPENLERRTATIAKSPSGPSQVHKEQKTVSRQYNGNQLTQNQQTGSKFNVTQSEDWEAEVDPYEPTMVASCFNTWKRPVTKSEPVARVIPGLVTKPESVARVIPGLVTKTETVARVNPGLVSKSEPVARVTPGLTEKQKLPTAHKPVESPVERNNPVIGTSSVSAICDIPTSEVQPEEKWSKVQSKKRHNSKEQPVRDMRKVLLPTPSGPLKQPTPPGPLKQPTPPGLLKQQKMSNFERLVSKMHDAIPHADRQSIIDAIARLRQLRGSLSGLSMEVIIEKCKCYIQSRSDSQPGVQRSVSSTVIPSNLMKPHVQPPVPTKVAPVKMMMPHRPHIHSPESNRDEDVCVICFEPLESLRTKELDCQHVFHEKCIGQWVERERTCPTCRQHALFTEDFPRL